MSEELCAAVMNAVNRHCSDIKAIRPLKGGINSRVYRVEGAVSLVVKYYADPARGKKEIAFLNALCSCNVDQVPRVVGADKGHQWSICTDLGSKPVSRITREILDAAIYMQEKLVARSECLRRYIPLRSTAKEGCFSNREHLDTLSRRVELLRQSKYIHTRPLMISLLQRRALDEAFRFTEACRMGVVPDKVETWLSQSDVGIHNMLRDKQIGKYRFIDFEYAGWDDKAKFFIDWMVRPDSLMSTKDCEYLLDSAYSKKLLSKKQQARIVSMMGLYICKWSIIRFNYLVRSQHHDSKLCNELELDICQYQERAFELKARLEEKFL